MSNSMLIVFWVVWLLDVLLALYGYREFIQGVFGQYAAPNAKYIFLWTGLLLGILAILGGSLYLKRHDSPVMAVGVAAAPLVLLSPYGLFLLAMLVFGRNTRWN